MASITFKNISIRSSIQETREVFASIYRQGMESRVILFVLLSLFAIDVGFISIHIFIRGMVHYSPEFAAALSNPNFDINLDWAYPETFDYIKSLFVILILGHLFTRTRVAMYLAWAIVYCVILADDSLQLHETFGQIMADNFHLPAIYNLRNKDTGEMLTWMALGLPVVASLYYGFVRSAQEHRSVGNIFAILFVALVFFAIGLDMMHQSFARLILLDESASTALSRSIAFVLAVVEDGGEMLVLTVTVAFALAAHRYVSARRSTAFASSNA